MLQISKDADRLKVIFKNALSTSATANFKELLRVVRVIKRMLIATVAEATPTGEEAQRALGFFINSLSHPSLDRPTSLDKMWSWSILTPLYEEDVLYPLEGATLAKEVRSAPAVRDASGLRPCQLRLTSPSRVRVVVCRWGSRRRS